MKLDLNEIVVHLGKRIRYDIDEPAIDEIDEVTKCVAPITGDVTFLNAGRHIIARGGFRTTVETECSRCLRRYHLDLDIPIEEELRVAGHTPDVAEDEVEEEVPEEEKEPLFVDGIFDLTEFLRQNILVAAPIKTLCSDECKGLCPHCGKNLNDGPCDCPPDQDAGPFAELASLIEKEEPNQT